MRVPRLLLAAELTNSPDPDAPGPEIPGFAQVTGRRGDLVEFSGVGRQPSEEMRLIATAGFTNLPDEISDGIHVPLLFRYRGEVIPSFAFEAILLWLRPSSWYDRVATFMDAFLVVLATSVAVSAYAAHSSHWYRAHLPDVLVVRVKGLAPEELWRSRYDSINDFERMLVREGTVIVKFFLHISKDEQKRRFEERLQRPDKRWKFRRGDLDERARWDDYMAAYDEAFARTSTAEAPWYVVPADHKWYRTWVVSKLLVDTLEEMDPQYPEPAEDLDEVTTPD